MQTTLLPVEILANRYSAGTESETIPLSLGNNDLQPLTCPDSNYFKWQQKVTSAQYYVNPKGISTKKGCQWGDGSEPIGNWAPINLGVGENNGKWLSIAQNAPTTNEKLDFNIKIKGSDLGGSCKYEDGSFISDTGSNDSGCTVRSPFINATISARTNPFYRSRSTPAMPPLSSTERLPRSRCEVRFFAWPQSAAQIGTTRQLRNQLFLMPLSAIMLSSVYLSMLSI